MALGAAIATGKPQVYTVEPGPGLLNSAAALLTADGMNAPVLALTGQTSQSAIGRGLGQLHEIRDRPESSLAWSISPGVSASRRRLRASSPRRSCNGSGQARPGSAGMRHRRLGPKRARCCTAPPSPAPRPPLDEDAIAAAAQRLASAKRPLIVAGGARRGECRGDRAVTPLQAPVLAYRRGRGVLEAAIHSASPCRSAANYGARPT